MILSVYVLQVSLFRNGMISQTICCVGEVNDITSVKQNTPRILISFKHFTLVSFHAEQRTTIKHSDWINYTFPISLPSQSILHESVSLTIQISNILNRRPPRIETLHQLNCWIASYHANFNSDVIKHGQSIRPYMHSIIS